MSSRWTYVVVAALAVVICTTAASAATINVPGDHPTIQGAVDAAIAGDTIVIAAGTYREQIKIDGKDLDLVGAGTGATIVEAVDLVNRTTYSVTKWSGSSETIDPCIGIVGPATVNIADLTVDGRELGPDHFYGIYYFDADGSVSSCEIAGIIDASAPSRSRIVSLVATHGVGGSTDVAFSSNTIPDFQKGGILVMGTSANCDLSGNEISDVPSSNLAGNGIQISYGATGTTLGNIVNGVGYTGEDWAGTGILLFESGSVAMDGDEVLNCESAVNYSDWGWVHVHPSQVALDFVNLDLHDNAWPLGVQLSRDGSDVDVGITGCTIVTSTGDGIDLWGTGLDPWGGTYYTGWDNGNLTASIEGCTISGADLDGIWTADLSGNATNTSSVTVHECSFSGNVSSAVNHNLPEEMDATRNYWGDADGPTLPPPPRGGVDVAVAPPSPFGIDAPGGSSAIVKNEASRAGGTIYGLIDYSPWYASPPGTVPMTWGTDDEIQEAIDLAAAGDIVDVTAGYYEESNWSWKDLDIIKSLTLRGAGSGATTIGLADNGSNGVEIRGTDLDVRLEGLTFTRRTGNTVAASFNLRIGETSSTFTSLEMVDVEVAYANGRNVFFDGSGTYDNILVEDCNFHHSGAWGFSLRGVVDAITVTDSHFDDNGVVDSEHGIGFDIDMPLTVNGPIVVSGGTFNRNTSKGINLVKTANATFDGIDASDNSGAAAGAFGVSLWEWQSASSNLEFTNSTFTGNALDGFLFGTQDTYTIDDVTISGCNITGNGRWGVFLYHDYGGSASNIEVTSCDLSGNSAGGLGVSANPYTIDASGNWWGSADPAAVAGQVTSMVDYTPWLASGTDIGDPGFQGDFSELWVDDDSPQTGPLGRIGEAIADVSGSTVNVAAGTYGESVYIDKTVTLLGAQANVDPRPSQGGRTGVESVVDAGEASSYVFRIASASDVEINGFSITGGTGDMVEESGHADGLEFRYNIVYDDLLTSGDEGLQVKYSDGVVVEYNYCYDILQDGLNVSSNTGPCVVQDNEMHDIHSENAAIYCYDATDIDIIGNLVYDVPNNDGIKLGDSGDSSTGGEVSGNTVSNCGEDGITIYASAATVTGNEVYGCDSENGAMYLSGSDGTVVTGNVIHDNDAIGLLIKASDGVTVTGNQIYNNEDTNDTKYAFTAGVASLADATGVVVNYNSIYDNAEYGLINENISYTLDATNNWWGDATGPFHPTLNAGGLGNEVSDYVDFDPYSGMSTNIVCDPDPLYISEGANPGVIDVNYLGGGSGLMYGYSVKFSWDGSVVSTAPGSVTEGSLLDDAGNTQFYALSTGTNEITVDCALLGAMTGVSGPGTMFSIEFTGLDVVDTSPVDITVIKVRDQYNTPLTGFFEDDGLISVDITGPSVANVYIENTTLSHTDDYVKDTDGVTITADVSDNDPSFGGANITADLSGFGGGAAVNPDSYAGGVASWTLAGVTCAPSDGTVTVTVTATDAMSNSASDSDDITSDNTLPGAITGFDAAPAHEEVALVWDDPTGLDTNYYGVVVRYAAWGDYPFYDVAAPAYPADEATGDGEAFSGLGAVTGATHGVVPRDIHYYSAFAYDWALNYGPVTSGGQDRATNYWLGDVATTLGTWGYNGLVNAADIDKLGLAFGQTNPTGNEAECDVGPTDDFSRLGIPEPDDVVDFEDLMVFAMNYGVVAARVVPFLPDTPAEELMLAMSQVRSADGTVDVAIRLEGNAGEVKGISAEIAYNPSEVEFVSAQLTENMHSPIAPVFFWHGENESSVQVDLAVLGTDVTIGGCGDVAVLTFRPVSGDFTLEFAEAVLRDAENNELTAELGGFDSKGDVPERFRLVQNSPNPFNPVTTIGYHMPNEAPVSIRVYDVSGRLVRTLVDGVVEPGRHQAVWDGRSENGESVGSGVYFCVMETPEYRGSTKMTLLK